MIDADVVLLSRLQFAATALYHFIFVPLTMGLVFLLAMMETVYVVTKKPIWRDMVKFWGTLFGINFAMGVATGITMEFQFGTNWAYYAHYVGDIFGAPLAIEGMMAFFLEATFVGIFFFGWGRVSDAKHAFCTWLLALGTNLSAIWILIANGWMQYPAGSKFNVDTMRMEVTSFADVIFNPVAQVKFLHTISGAYVTGSMFVLSISAWYLLKGRHIEIAKRSIRMALLFGFIASVSVVFFGDEGGYEMGKFQPMKLAAIEAMWEPEEAPASFTLVGFPSQTDKKTYLAIKIPKVLGLIATRSLDGKVESLRELTQKSKDRIESGLIAYEALDKWRTDKDNEALKALFETHGKDLGYALLLKKFTPDILNASQEDIQKAAESTVPHVPTLFWSFRIMVGCGFYFILLFGLGTFLAKKKKLEGAKWFLWPAFLSLPLPWLSAELGWVVAELGRQPWTIDGILPTFLSASSTTSGNVLFTLIGFVVFYSTLLVVDVFLMLKYARLGPQEITHVKAS